jgi:hypothetical protein
MRCQHGKRLLVAHVKDASADRDGTFISGVFPAPLQAGLRDLATPRRLDISDSARMFAAVEVAVADSLAASWDAKYLYGFWRPITAIDARVWSGIHFRTADVVSNEMSKKVANWTVDRYFRPAAR